MEEKRIKFRRIRERKKSNPKRGIIFYYSINYYGVCVDECRSNSFKNITIITF